MLVALALPGDGGGIDFGGDVAAGAICGELCDFRSSLLPRIDDIDILPPGLLEEKEARSRIPGKGDAVGGPSGTDPGSEGEGGGICRD